MKQASTNRPWGTDRKSRTIPEPAMTLLSRGPTLCVNHQRDGSDLFDSPIPLPGGRQLVTLTPATTSRSCRRRSIKPGMAGCDASSDPGRRAQRTYNVCPHRRHARHVERVSSDRKDTHWSKRNRRGINERGRQRRRPESLQGQTTPRLRFFGPGCREAPASFGTRGRAHHKRNPEHFSSVD